MRSARGHFCRPVCIILLCAVFVTCRRERVVCTVLQCRWFIHMLIFRLLDIGPRPSLPKTKKHKKTRLETGLRLRGRVPPFPSKPHIFQSSHTHLPFSRQVNPYAKSFLASRGSEHGRILVQVVFFALMPSSPCHAHVAMWPRLPCGHVAMPCCLVGSGRQALPCAGVLRPSGHSKAATITPARSCRSLQVTEAPGDRGGRRDDLVRVRARA